MFEICAPEVKCPETGPSQSASQRFPGKKSILRIAGIMSIEALGARLCTTQILASARSLHMPGIPSRRRVL